MKTAITNFLTLNVMSSHPVVYVGLAGVWLVILIASFVSVRSLPVSTAAKVFWLAVILLLPVVGLGLYCFYCLCRADWGFLEIFLSKPKPNTNR